jgi:hypothetical protein
MTSAASVLKRKPELTSQPVAARYFGLEVEVVAQMETCTLIRYQQRESIVETRDLETAHYAV